MRSTTGALNVWSRAAKGPFQFKTNDLWKMKFNLTEHISTLNE